MNKLLVFLRPLLTLNLKHPFLVVGVAILLAVISGSFAVQLKVDTDIANLLPANNPNVLALEDLKDKVGGETDMQVVIKSPDFEANKAFAEALIPKSLELFYPRHNDKFFKRAEYRKDTEVLKDNALYLASTEELNEISSWLKEEIDNAKEEANPFLLDFDDDFDDEEESSENKADKFKESYEVLVPSEYPVNEDSTIMVLKFFPTGSKSDIRYLEDMFVVYDSLITALGPASFHPEMQVKFGGRLERHVEELTSIMDDVIGSFASGISSVILLVMLYFFIKKYLHYRNGASEGHTVWSHVIRIPVPILIIGIPLLVSLLWTFGIAYLYLGVLNTMTSVLFVILFGLAIDYGIHFYARYIELRSTGLDVEEAIYATSETTGQAIVVSAVTTAAALYILMFAEFRGFSEFGFISGTGILLAFLCMLFILPSVLVIFEKWNWILITKDDSAPAKTGHRYPFSRTLIVLGIALTVLVVGFSGKLEFQYDFGKLEPTFPKYEEFRKLSGQVGESTKRNPAYIIAETDEEVDELVAAINKLIDEEIESGTRVIHSVESLQERFPTTKVKQDEKLEAIAKIRGLLRDPFIVGKKDDDLDKLRRASKTTIPLNIDDIPDYLKSQFITKDGEIGRFVIIYPEGSLSDGKRSIAFKDAIGKIQLDNGKIFYAASTSIVAANMLDLMRTESPYMVGATFIFIYLFMLFTFRSFRWSIIAMFPLLVGLIWLFGIMIIFDLQFNFYNLVVLPAILGIGEDSGVHLAHRYREEGKNSMWQVLSSTGQHVTMGSLTTMLGFAGLLFTNHPGLQSLGIMAVVGIGMTLLTSLTFLPALIQWMEDKDLIKF
ncbi:MAG: MMPL family transporter [Balneolaceae bacterium]